jgi:hypothetical protein
MSQIWSDVAQAQDPWPALDFRYHIISFLHSDPVNGLIWGSSNQEPLAYISLLYPQHTIMFVAPIPITTKLVA